MRLWRTQPLRTPTTDIEPRPDTEAKVIKRLGTCELFPASNVNPKNVIDCVNNTVRICTFVIVCKCIKET